jgi:hypothetical protein
MSSPSTFDHYRFSGDSHPDGVYRVVGTNGETVTMLRVGTADGRRVHTGEIRRVETSELAGLERADNPDGQRSIGSTLASTVTTSYWSLRVFAEQLAAHPFATAVAAVPLVVGTFGDQFLSLPETTFGVLVLVGSLGLAYVGSGRL